MATSKYLEKMRTVFKIKKPYRVGIYVDENDYNEFKRACAPHSVSYAVSRWLHDQAEMERAKK